MYVLAVLKQKIRAVGIKIKRCREMPTVQFRTSQKVFYETLDGTERCETELPEPTKTTTFWSAYQVGGG